MKYIALLLILTTFCGTNAMCQSCDDEQSIITREMADLALDNGGWEDPSEDFRNEFFSYVTNAMCQSGDEQSIITRKMANLVLDNTGFENSSEDFRNDFFSFVTNAMQTLGLNSTNKFDESSFIERAKEFEVQYKQNQEKGMEDAKARAEGADKFVDKFLSYIDKKQFREAYQLFSPSAQNKIEEAEWIRQLEANAYLNMPKKSDKWRRTSLVPGMYNNKVFGAEYYRYSRLNDDSWPWLKDHLLLEYRNGKWDMQNYFISLSANKDEEHFPTQK